MGTDVPGGGCGRGRRPFAVVIMLAYRSHPEVVRGSRREAGDGFRLTRVVFLAGGGERLVVRPPLYLVFTGASEPSPRHSHPVFVRGQVGSIQRRYVGSVNRNGCGPGPRTMAVLGENLHFVRRSWVETVDLVARPGRRHALQLGVVLVRGWPVLHIVGGGGRVRRPVHCHVGVFGNYAHAGHLAGAPGEDDVYLVGERAIDPVPEAAGRGRISQVPWAGQGPDAELGVPGHCPVLE